MQRPDGKVVPTRNPHKLQPGKVAGRQRAQARRQEARQQRLAAQQPQQAAPQGAPADAPAGGQQLPSPGAWGQFTGALKRVGQALSAANDAVQSRAWRVRLWAQHKADTAMTAAVDKIAGRFVGEERRKQIKEKLAEQLQEGAIGMFSADDYIRDIVKESSGANNLTEWGFKIAAWGVVQGLGLFRRDASGQRGYQRIWNKLRGQGQQPGQQPAPGGPEPGKSLTWRYGKAHSRKSAADYRGAARELNRLLLHFARATGAKAPRITPEQLQEAIEGPARGSKSLSWQQKARPLPEGHVSKCRGGHRHPAGHGGPGRT